MDILITRRPGPALAPFVEVLWYYNSDVREGTQDRVLPHGEFELVISLNGPLKHTLISGPQTGPMIVDPGAFSPIAGAHFKPGGAAAIFGQNARAFRNTDVPLEDVWSRHARSIQAELQDIADPELCLARLEYTLTRAAQQAPAQHPAVALAIDEFHRDNPTRRIRELVDESGISQRRFIELFTDHVGITPKLYARIQRFQRTLHRAVNQQRVDWINLACEAGYSDQAHLIRDFREFSGLRPSDYTPRWPDQPNHVPLS